MTRSFVRDVSCRIAISESSSVKRGPCSTVPLEGGWDCADAKAVGRRLLEPSSASVGQRSPRTPSRLLHRRAVFILSGLTSHSRKVSTRCVGRLAKAIVLPGATRLVGPSNVHVARFLSEMTHVPAALQAFGTVAAALAGAPGIWRRCVRRYRTRTSTR